MDIVDNKHMERILSFVGEEELTLETRVSKDERFPWLMRLHKSENNLFTAYGVTLSDVLKRTSSYVHRIQAERIEPTAQLIEEFPSSFFDGEKLIEPATENVMGEDGANSLRNDFE